MLIAIDIDEVLAEFMQGFLRFHNQRYRTAHKKSDFKKYQIESVLGGDEESSLKRINEFYAHRTFSQIQPVKYSKTALRKLAKNNELVALTARSHSIAEETEEWVDRNYRNLIQQVYFTNQFGEGNSTTKARVCYELKARVIIDDSLDYSVSCVKQNERLIAILPDRPWNQTPTLHPRIYRSRDWREVPEIIETLKN